MNLSYGVLFLCLSAILFGIGIVFFRNPKLPKWVDGFVFISTSVTIMIGLGSTGLILITFAFKNMGAISLHNLFLSVAMVCATALTLWFLHIPEKLKEYAHQKATIVSLKPVEAHSGPDDGLGRKPGRLAA